MKRYIVHVANTGFYVEAATVFLPGGNRERDQFEQKRFEAGKAALLTLEEADALVKHITERGGTCTTTLVDLPDP